MTGSTEVRGKLVSKRIFKKFGSRGEGRETVTILILVLITEKGNPIEVKSFSPTQAYTVYRKVNPNQSYVLTFPTEEVKPANGEFSTAKYEISRYWWIEETDEEIRLSKSLPCTIELQKAIDATTGNSPHPVNILASFRRLEPGPHKGPLIGGKPLVQGYYVHLADKVGVEFYVLVWRLTRVDRRKDFDVLDADPGELVLIQGCRAARPPEEGHIKRRYTLNSCYPPVLNSECVSHRRIQELKA